MISEKGLIPFITMVLISMSFMGPVQGYEDGYEWSLGDPGLMDKEAEGHFIENLGQWNDSISFVGETDSGRIGLGEGSIYHELRTFYPDNEKEEDYDRDLVTGYILKMDLLRSNKVIPTGSEALHHPTSYFKGNDPSKWVSGARSYQKVEYSNIWNGIDLEYIISDAGPKYTYTVHPGADVNSIKIECEGQSSIDVRPDRISFGFDEGIDITDSGLLAYYRDDGTLIPVRFVAEGNIIGFELKNRDPSRTVVIDPIMNSTFFGGSSGDLGYPVIVDENGDYIVAGETYSTDFPTTPGSLKQGYSGVWGDMFVIKMNKSLQTLDYSFIFGGDHAEEIGGIDIDNGEVVVSGYTQSSDFQTTPGCYQNESLGGWRDPYLVKINRTGTGLIFSTIISGSDDEFGYGVKIAENDEIILVGYTGSTDFPVTSDAYSSTKNGTYDGFMLKMLPNGTDLVYSSYFGGNGFDSLGGIEITDNGDILFTGSTSSTDLYMPAGAYDGTLSGSSDGLILKMDSNLSKVQAATTFGSGPGNGINDIEIKNNGDLAILCYGTGYPVTAGSLDTTGNGGNDFVISQMDINLTTLGLCTYLGGSQADDNGGLCIDSKDNFIVCGFTQSTDFPTTPGAYDESYNGTNNVNGFISKIDASGKYLMYSTFYGGSGRTYARGFALTSDFSVVLTGSTNSPDFPVSAGAYDTTMANDPDIYITEFSFLSAPTSPENLTGIKGYDWIHLNWETPFDDGGRPITGYLVYKLPKVGMWEMVASLPSTTLEFNITGLAPDGDYVFYVVATNVIGASYASNGVRFHDNIRPWLETDLTFSDSFPLGSTTFKIRANDNTFLSSAFVEYWMGDHFGNMNLTMEKEGLFHSVSVDHPDEIFEMRYLFRFNDTSNNWFNSQIFSINITGEVRPSIVQDLTPDTVKAGEVLNFRVEASDNDEVKSVHLEFRSNSGQNSNVSMNMIGPDIYEYRFPTKRYSLAPITYSFHVKDVSGHWNNSDEKIITILDVDSPVLSYDRTPQEAIAGQELIFEISVNDNQRLDQVWILYTVENGPLMNATMEKKQGSVYEYSIAVPHILGRIRYSFHALDENGNIGWLPEKAIAIVDKEKPVIVSDHTNITGETGNHISFEFELSDNIGIEKAVLEYWTDPEDRMYLELAKGRYHSGDVELPISYTGSLSYIVTAYDLSGNSISSEVAMIEMMDIDDPILVEDLTPSHVGTGERIEFSIRAIDNRGIRWVKVEYGWAGELSENIMIDEQNENSLFTWSINARTDDLSTMNYRFRIEDLSGNVLMTEVREIIVSDTLPPVITPLSDVFIKVSTTTEINILVEVSDNIELEEVIISGSPIEPVSQRIKGFVDEPGSYLIDVRAVDVYGNEAIYRFNIEVTGEEIEGSEESNDIIMFIPPVIAFILLLLTLFLLFVKRRRENREKNGPVDLNTLSIQNGEPGLDPNGNGNENSSELDDLFNS